MDDKPMDDKPVDAVNPDEPTGASGGETDASSAGASPAAGAPAATADDGDGPDGGYDDYGPPPPLPFKQHGFFFQVCLALFIGALLPWEGAWLDSYGFRSFGGAFILAFAGYGMVATFWNIHHRQMIVTPALLASAIGVFSGWKRVFQLVDAQEGWKFDSTNMTAIKRSLAEFFHFFGPGLLLTVVFATLFWFAFIMMIIKGGKAAAARREAEKAARPQRRR